MLELIYYFYGWVGGSVDGWVVRFVGNKADLSPSSVVARVKAELGNRRISRHMSRDPTSGRFSTSGDKFDLEVGKALLFLKPQGLSE